MNFQGHDFAAAAPRRLAGALGVSALLHLLVLAGPGWSSREPRATALEATLRSSAGAVPAMATASAAAEPAPRAAAPRSRASPPEAAPAVVAADKGSFPAPAAPQLPAQSDSADAGPATASPVAPPTTVSTAAPSRGAVGSAGSATPAGAPADGLDADGLRQYRVALGVEAGRFKRYPQRAREAGWQGTAEVRVGIGGDGTPLPAQLVRSSGFEALDAAALDMLGRAAPRTAVPPSLRGRAFSVVVPVQFDLVSE